MSYGKLILSFNLTVLTGMHIGGSSGFSAIGAVDQPVIRDPRTGDPILPGSSLKGKLRTLLAKKCSQSAENLPEWSKDDPRILRLFGSSEPVRASRLQFSDAFVSNKQELRTVGLTEVKTENSINRSTCIANPRQIERVVAGTRFRVCVTYDVADQAQVQEDMEMLATGLRLLQMDYLGGHGSRGSGRVSLNEFSLDAFGTELETPPLLALFQEVAGYELLPL